MPVPKTTGSIILSRVRKNLKHVELDWHPQDYLDTGIEDLNRVLGHPQLGLPYGRPIEISGWESHGKTSLATTIAGIGQAQGAFVVLVDFENSYEESWTRKRGVNPDKDFLVFSTYEGTFPGEKTPRAIYGNELCTEMEKALPMIRESYNRIILLMDSIPAILLPEKDNESVSVFKQNQALAAFLSRKFPGWTAKFRTCNVLPIFINQLRQNPMQMFGSPEYTPGGNTQKFHYHARVRVRRSKGGKISQSGKTIGIQGTMTSTKNKSGGTEGSKVGYKIYFDGPTEFLDADQLKKGEEDDGG